VTPAAGAGIRAVTFDFWNTLVAEGVSTDHRSDRWRDALAHAGHDVAQEVLERAMTDLWSWFTGRWEGNEVVTPEDAVRQALDLMAVPSSPPLLEAMVATLHEGYDPEQVRTASGIGAALEGLKSAGVRVGIICDVGLTPSVTLRRYLDHHGLLRHFDAWSFSDDVGCYKPDPRIFAHAAEVLGVEEPSAMAHIGDLRRTDVAGARAAGWTSVRYTGFFDDQVDLPDADVVVGDHADLVAALGR
jgi:putative hydrolase of the HAD superfamily